jgi:hypothetical protein
MENCIVIKDLDELSDGYLLRCRSYGTQEGALLVLVTRRAFKLYHGSENNNDNWVFIPMDNIDPLVNMFDESGLDLSYG